MEVSVFRDRGLRGWAEGSQIASGTAEEGPSQANSHRGASGNGGCPEALQAIKTKMFLKKTNKQKTNPPPPPHTRNKKPKEKNIGKGEAGREMIFLGWPSQGIKSCFLSPPSGIIQYIKAEAASYLLL